MPPFVPAPLDDWVRPKSESERRRGRSREQTVAAAGLYAVKCPLRTTK